MNSIMQRIEKLENRSNYIIVYDFFTGALNLSGIKLLVFSKIYGFSRGNSGSGCFNGSLDYLANAAFSTKRQIISVLKELVRDKLLVKTETGKGRYSYMINYQTVDMLTQMYTAETEESSCSSVNERISPELKAEHDTDDEKNSQEEVKKLHSDGEKISQEEVKKLHSDGEKISPKNTSKNTRKIKFKNTQQQNISCYDSCNLVYQYSASDKPTFSQVKNYCLDNMLDVDYMKFWDKYAPQDFQGIHDWKRLMYGWHRKNSSSDSAKLRTESSSVSHSGGIIKNYALYQAMSGTGMAVSLSDIC